MGSAVEETVVPGVVALPAGIVRFPARDVRGDGAREDEGRRSWRWVGVGFPGVIVGGA